ncbi:MAG: hypothetical protein IJN67_02625 [Oscillospiraceae bacterium]|nr:hypothetical protein [Oscillospiraceae bacterium]
MISEEMLSDEALRQAAEKCAEAIIASLPAPEECNHKFSKRFEEKMQALLQPKTVCIISPEFISK